MKKPVLISLLSGLIMLTGFFMPAEKQTLQFEFLPQSKVKMEGSSNVTDFSCYNSAVNGTIRFSFDPSSFSVSESHTRMYLQVGNFECGNAMMESDMQEALKASQYPKIELNITSGKIMDTLYESTTGKYYKLKVMGKIIVAGTSRHASAIFTCIPKDGYYHLTGTKSIDMTKFGIDPPTAMFGMIKADNIIHLNFDLAIAQS